LEWDQEEPNLFVDRPPRWSDESPIKDASLMVPEVRSFSHYLGVHPEGYSEGPCGLVRSIGEA